MATAAQASSGRPTPPIYEYKNFDPTAARASAGTLSSYAPLIQTATFGAVTLLATIGANALYSFMDTSTLIFAASPYILLSGILWKFFYDQMVLATNNILRLARSIRPTA